MSAEKDPSPSPSPIRSKSEVDHDSAKALEDAKPTEAKGGIGHYFVSLITPDLGKNGRMLMLQSASSSTQTVPAGR